LAVDEERLAGERGLARPEPPQLLLLVERGRHGVGGEDAEAEPELRAGRRRQIVLRGRVRAEQRGERPGRATLSAPAGGDRRVDLSGGARPGELGVELYPRAEEEHQLLERRQPKGLSQRLDRRRRLDVNRSDLPGAARRPLEQPPEAREPRYDGALVLRQSGV